MDRFAIGKVDVQTLTLEWIGNCGNEKCLQNVHLGDEVLQNENGEYFCSDYCYVIGTGGKYTEAWEVI